MHGPAETRSTPDDIRGRKFWPDDEDRNNFAKKTTFVGTTAVSAELNITVESDAAAAPIDILQKIWTQKTMRQIALLSMFTVLMSDVATADVVRHSSIPESYWGKWVGAAETGTDKSVIVLSAKSYAAVRRTAAWIG